MPKNEVATKQEYQIQDAAMLDLLAEYAGAGGEEVSQDDVMTPRYCILQALSPQVKKNNAKYVDGAEDGMIYNNVDNIVIEGDVGIKVIPAAYKRHFIEWDADTRGKLIDVHPASYDTSKCTLNAKGKLVNSAGNIVEDTREWYVVVVNDDGTVQPAIISMTSTQIKKSKRWVSQLEQMVIPGTNKKAPYFLNVYEMTTVPESKDDNDWFGWKIERAGYTTQLPNAAAILEVCKNFYKQVKANEVRVSRESDTVDNVEDEGF